ncbi:hypothetical protein ASF41_13155 [Methylobacterium sp. Leaf111]|uniref:hypothetical protein n=1 Tax=Methylobacterium sp. Leaf111 TaxID=1736257 RepID=UPI0006F63BDE|nr:hypothetical protein [Methylobacterium sp. Leaf111]KQP51128.1 hypothetical protein ASF41_13155 [Methylobacterium sp. Leaf111]
MNLDRQLARLMAAMIVMIIAYVSPSAVQAHEGHAHHGHHQAAMVEVAPAAPVAGTTTVTVVVTEVASAIVPAASRETVAGSAAVGSIRSDEADGGCCPGPCKGKCCGTMSCCVPGILGGTVSLPTLAFGHVVLGAHDVDGRTGVGPEALPRPPRTLA